MRSVVYTMRRRVSIGLKPDVIKLAVQHPVNGQPRLFAVRRDLKIADFEKILRAEFPSVNTLNFYIHDHTGTKTSLTNDELARSVLFEENKDKELSIEADGTEIGMRYDTSSSELKKRFILDLADDTIKENLLRNKSSVLNTEFVDYLNNQFKRDFKASIEVKRGEIENRKAAIDIIISKWEGFKAQFIDYSIKRSMRPVKALLLLSSLQFLALFYLTYFVYDWEVVEPLAYMTTLTLQFLVIAGFAFKRKLLGPELFFESNMQKMKHLLNRNLFYTEELYIKKRALENLLILFK